MFSIGTGWVSGILDIVLTSDSTLFSSDYLEQLI